MRKRWPKMWMHIYSQVGDHPLGQACRIAEQCAVFLDPEGRLWVSGSYREEVMRDMVTRKKSGMDFEEAAREVLALWVARRLKG